MRTTTVIIGAGHAGLAMSRRLTERSIDHVVIERGEVANAWRTERWPSLRLLTPNWQTRLPGLGYEGDDPDGYMGAPEVARFLVGYAAEIDAPVRTGTRVTAVRRRGKGFEVVTHDGAWLARSVVLASGACNVPAIPALAGGLPASINSLSPMDYRCPEHLAPGGVLIVGASATGVQLANEVAGHGRPVTLAVGEHVRLPRRYRGRDVFWWMEATGVLDEGYDQVDDLLRARNVPSPQLVGSPQGVTVDLNSLISAGVRVVGRLGRIEGGSVQFSGGLAGLCALADLKMHRLLNRFDRWAAVNHLDDVEPPHRLEPTRIGSRPTLTLDLSVGEIGTVIWATGYRPDYSWLEVPVIGRRGRLLHDGGVVTGAPGMYVLGAPFLRRRRSSFIHGAIPDTHELSDHLVGFLGRRDRR